MADVSARICPEDVVCLISDPGTPGMVCCVGEDTDARGAPPTAHVYWLRELDNDRMEPITDLRILDRALLHGDTVIHNKRKGVVTATKIFVDMRYSDGSTVSLVDTAHLKHLQPFRQGNWVVADGWLGRVLSCREDVIVQFTDDSQCLVSSSANGELHAVQKMYERSPFFPSMEVKAASAETFLNAHWITGAYRKHKTGVIASTRPSEVLVAWVAALQGSSSQPPATSCLPEQLKLLNHFGHTWWRLGDRSVYVRPDSLRSAKGALQVDDLHNCCEIVGTHTEVDIKYLDGSTAARVPATSTLMVNPGPHEFYPGDLVCDKDPVDKDRGAISVVLSADERSRMASVRRVMPIRTKAEEGFPREEEAAVTTSVFDLVAHPDFSFRIGDAVLRLDASSSQSNFLRSFAPFAPLAPLAASKGVHGSSGLENGEERGARRAASANDAVDKKNEACWNAERAEAAAGTVGEVMDVMADGMVVVAWLGDAGTSPVHPEQIYRVAIEEEVEDAMFYQEEGGFPAGASSAAVPPRSATTTLVANRLLVALPEPVTRLVPPETCSQRCGAWATRSYAYQSSEYW
ncbi:hypothetical protein T484DRAFT_1825629 [Baffinella frigidus]|nr:hypothetical protein T484DRAFT_1825629 [Cryptophyta sp. CCMP2293]